MTDRKNDERLDAILTAAVSDHPLVTDQAADRLVRRLDLPAQARARVIESTLAPAQAPRRRARSGRGWQPFVGLAAAAGALAAVGLGVSAGLADRARTIGDPGDMGEVAELAPAPAPLAPGRVIAQAENGAFERLGEGPLAARTPLRVGDALVATGPEVAVLRLDDGTRIHVHGDTTVRLREREGGGLTVAMSEFGRVFCQVARRAEPLRIEAGDLSAEVLGTEFGVDRDYQHAAVHVLRGQVRVAYRGQAVLVRPSQRVEAWWDTAGLAEPWTSLTWQSAAWVPEIAARPNPAVPQPRPSEPALPTTGTTTDSSGPSLDVPVAEPERE